MPTGSTSGSKLMSRALPARSVSAPVSVSVPGVDRPSIVRPRHGGVDRVVGGAHRQHQLPPQGTAADLPDQRVEQPVVTGTRRERVLLRSQPPPHRGTGTGLVDEMEGVERAEGAVGESRCRRDLFDDRQGGRRLRVGGHERVHQCGVRFSGPCNGFRRQQPVVEALRRIIGEHRQIDHRRAPLAAVGERERQAEAAHRVGRVGNEGIAAAQGEPAGHRGAAGSEHRRPRQLGTLAGAVEEPGRPPRPWHD